MVVVVDVCTVLEKDLCYAQTNVLVLIDIGGLSHAREAIEEWCVTHTILMISVSPVLYQQLHDFQVASHASSTQWSVFMVLCYYVDIDEWVLEEQLHDSPSAKEGSSCQWTDFIIKICFGVFFQPVQVFSYYLHVLQPFVIVGVDQIKNLKSVKELETSTFLRSIASSSVAMSLGSMNWLPV